MSPAGPPNCLAVLVSTGAIGALTLTDWALILKSRSAWMLNGPTSWSGTPLADNLRKLLVQDQLAVLVRFTKGLGLKALLL